FELDRHVAIADALERAHDAPVAIERLGYVQPLHAGVALRRGIAMIAAHLQHPAVVADRHVHAAKTETQPAEALLNPHGTPQRKSHAATQHDAVATSKQSPRALLRGPIPTTRTAQSLRARSEQRGPLRRGAAAFDKLRPSG